ncbi:MULTISPECIES: DUF1054 family protein [unclassified Enterococcus]|uniref:DUF1054 family protein n=1 Tax=unclassified Enterococcus TaxID=2608891 RepID=UPI001552B7E7|nr:DUF1054 family protein [Enterococcus sp. MMGLQ5-2]MBS7583897.1 DUF1054 family protein [Enterococcus sp. MMGLQ5-1]NPD11758.1 DUF1054 family protein [Enterococcus sp. MMGLQ5-1]NPD36453.1 DUF1054 family protein [Enterococcus sp. MMGLQ5-2]
MFDTDSFKVFEIEGLAPRMIAIRQEIQPIFQSIGEILKERIASSIGQSCFLHIAQHRRRTAYAPDNTWCAISTQKRGYKMEPHFQLGIWQNYVYLYLSIIDQPKSKMLAANYLAENPALLTQLPKQFVFSKDHTVPSFQSITEPAFQQAILRFQNVKKSELEIGKVFLKSQFEATSDQQMITDFLNVIDQLLPLYQKLLIVTSDY